MYKLIPPLPSALRYIYKFIASCNSNPCRNNLVWRKHFVILIYIPENSWLAIHNSHLSSVYSQLFNKSQQIWPDEYTKKYLFHVTSQNKLSLSRVVIENINFVRTVTKNFKNALKSFLGRVFWPTLIRLHISNLFLQIIF